MKEGRVQQLEQEIMVLNSALLLKEEQLWLKDKQLSLQEEQLSLKEEQLSLKEEEITRKNERILYLERQLYGRRSEKRLPDALTGQLSLFDSMHGNALLEEEKELTPIIDEIVNKANLRREKKKQKALTGKRSYQIPAHIERRESVIEPKNLDTTSMVKIGQDVSERLMVEPSRFWVERTVRPIYKKVKDKDSLSCEILQAAAKDMILPGCMAGESLLSRIIIDKFLYHIPEYRQAKHFKSQGIDIPTSSINRWVHALADKLYPLYMTQVQQVLSTDYIQVDETTLPVTDSPGKARKAYLWAVRSVMSAGVFFHYDKGSRREEVVLKLLKDYQGALQSDGYAAYSKYEDKQGVLPLGCLAHVRRKFETALTSSPQAQKGLDYIALLYMLEANLKEEGAHQEEIVRQRKEKAYPILCQMEKWMIETFNQTTPKSLLGKAIIYAFGMWPRISRYCSDGRFNIDNNGVENAIRPIALGRKNYLFAKNDAAAEDYCLFYTLIGSCLQAGIDPEQWFNSTLQIIPSLQTPIDWKELLPSNSNLPKSNLNIDQTLLVNS